MGYLTVEFLIQPLTVLSKSNASLKSLAEYFTVIFVLGLLVIIIALNAFLISRFYRIKYPNNYSNEIFHSNEVDFLQTIRNKVVIGLDNITTDFPEKSLTKELPIISNTSTMLDYFPSDMRNEINVKIKGKTIFTLIEIAYQDPMETNPTNISRSLNIPPSSLSREIKRLISLNYLETHVSDIVLNDARFRNFRITPKGFYFLSQLNYALKMTIDRMKSRDINVQPVKTAPTKG
jgi:DNA-binding MarR family transcriptional regulator